MNVIAIHRATLLYKQGPLSYSSKLVTAGGLRMAVRPQALSNKCWCQRVKLMGATLRDVKLVGNLARPNLGSAWVVGEKNVTATTYVHASLVTGAATTWAK